MNKLWIILSFFIMLNYCNNSEEKFLENKEFDYWKVIQNFTLQDNIQEFIMNLPANFKIYFKNYRNNKAKINEYIEEINREILYNPGLARQHIIDIYNILIREADFKDRGLVSFEEFEKFNNCFSNLYAGFQTDLKTIATFFKFISLNETLENFLFALTNFFEVKSDQIKYCAEYYRHLKI